MPLRHILVVEDETLLSLEIADVLASCAPCEITTSTTIAQAYESLEQPLDFAILDVQVIGGRTFELARELRARGVATAFLSGLDATEVPEDLRDLPFLQKPFDAQSLKRAFFVAIEKIKHRSGGG